MTGKRTAAPAPKPDVLTDPALNKFITGVLLDACDQGDTHVGNMGNTLIRRTVDQLRKWCPEAYAGGETGGNVHGGDGGNVQQWPDRIGA